jgi:hypothetical protein
VWFPNQLPGLLSNPGLIGIACNTSKMNASRTQFNEEEHLDGLKPGGIYSEKIAGQDPFFVVCQQMTPSNGTIANRHWLNSMPVENIAHSWLWNLETELDEFTLDFAISPTGLLMSKTENKFLKLFADWGSSILVLVWIGPFPANYWRSQK